ncbi:MAG: hypothetical protein PVG93_06330, partial [Phycisphaerales bacterium]
QRYIFLGELPDNLNNIKENKGSMLLAMSALAVLCLLMGLIVIIEPIREMVLTPAVSVLTDGLNYSARIIGEGLLAGN